MCCEGKMKDKYSHCRDNHQEKQIDMFYWDKGEGIVFVRGTREIHITIVGTCIKKNHK